MVPPAKKRQELTESDFTRLLSWLDSDPERAGSIYEKIRWRLITVLASRGCKAAEELADETIDRVAHRIKDIEATYVGDKSLYFLGVMNNVHHEYLKRPVLSQPSPIFQDENQVKERAHVCLDKCLDKLTARSRALIEQYYAGENRARIDLRRRIAQEFGITASVVRLRALRIRQKLQTCIEQCLEVTEARL